MSAGISKGAWCQPSASRVSLISSAPSGSPWALAVLARLGEPWPMCVLQMISVGRFLAAAGLDQRGVHGVGVVAVHGAQHLPAVGFKARGGVVDEPGLHLPVDGDAVVVVERDQLAQLPGAGERGGLVADAFHQAAVTQEGVGMVVHHAVAVAVELGGQQLLGQRHAHRVGDALAQRAGGGFHARGDAHFRVARGLAVHLAEGLELAHRQRVAGEVQQRVESASSRGRWTARSGRGRPSAGRRGCA